MMIKICDCPKCGKPVERDFAHVHAMQGFFHDCRALFILDQNDIDQIHARYSDLPPANHLPC